ncbi:AAA family ATPase, partial [Nocardia sp. NPDC004722]
AFAWLNGRAYTTPDDVKAVATAVLRHRLHLRPEHEVEGVTAEGVMASLLMSVPVPV